MYNVDNLVHKDVACEIPLCRCRGQVGREVHKKHAVSLYVLDCFQAIDDLVKEDGVTTSISFEMCSESLFLVAWATEAKKTLDTERVDYASFLVYLEVAKVLMNVSSTG